MVDPDEYQALLNARDGLDDEPGRLSRHEVQKGAAIITAGFQGHSAYVQATATVARYFQAWALETLSATTPTPADSATLWQAPADMPWPTRGAPAHQAT